MQTARFESWVLVIGRKTVHRGRCEIRGQDGYIVRKKELQRFRKLYVGGGKLRLSTIQCLLELWLNPGGMTSDRDSFNMALSSSVFLHTFFVFVAILSSAYSLARLTRFY